MEALIGFLATMGGVLLFATLYKPQMRNPGTLSQRCRATECPCRDTNHRTTGGSSNG